MHKNQEAVMELQLQLPALASTCTKAQLESWKGAVANNSDSESVVWQSQLVTSTLSAMRGGLLGKESRLPWYCTGRDSDHFHLARSGFWLVSVPWGTSTNRTWEATKKEKKEC